MCSVACRHELKVDSWEDVPFSNETELAKAVSQTPVIVAICCGPAIDDWHHYAGTTDSVLHYRFELGCLKCTCAYRFKPDRESLRAC